MTYKWALTYLGDEWRWDSEPYGKVVNVDWAWRELKDAGEELPEAVNSEDGDSGLQSQELQAEQGHVPRGKRRERTVNHIRAGKYDGHQVRVVIQTKHGGGIT